MWWSAIQKVFVLLLLLAFFLGFLAFGEYQEEKDANDSRSSSEIIGWSVTHIEDVTILEDEFVSSEQVIDACEHARVVTLSCPIVQPVSAETFQLRNPDPSQSPEYVANLTHFSTSVENQLRTVSGFSEPYVFLVAEGTTETLKLTVTKQYATGSAVAISEAVGVIKSDFRFYTGVCTYEVEIISKSTCDNSQ